jgi:predicted Zn-dependent protease
MPFNVTYFDGITSKTIAATLSANSLGWNISYADASNKPMLVHWNLDQIKKSSAYTKGLVVFNYNEQAPFQKIESSDINFIEYLEKNPHPNLTNTLDSFLHKTRMSSLVTLMLVLTSLGLLTYFYIIPSVATHFVSKLSDKNVIAFGDYVFNVLSKDLDIDEEKSREMQEFLDRMKIESAFPLEIFVADSYEMNAFALSGGKMVIYTELLNKLENEAQLAALIGHEVSHIENRHILQNIARDLSGALFVSILMGDLNGVSTIFAENAHRFKQLSYSRELEKEADIFGLEIMKKNNVNLHGMPELFEILKGEDSFEISAYLSNHPALDDRIEYTTKIADEYPQISSENIELKEQWSIIKTSLE